MSRISTCEKQKLRIQELEKKNRTLENEIRERRQIEKNLRESKERYHTLFKNNPIETIAVDRDGRVTEYNLAKKMSGNRLPNIGDVMYKDYASKHDIDMYNALLESISTGALKEFPERKYQDKILYIRISPLKDGAIITSIDISEYKRAEAALRASKDYLSAILNRIADPIWVKDRDHRWVQVNDKFCKIIGYSRTELFMQSDYDFFPKKEVDAWREREREVFLTGRESISEEYFSNSSTGEAFFLNTKMSLYEDKKGNKFVVAIGRDLSARKRAEEALRESEEKFRTLTENTTDITIVINYNCIVKYVSPSIARVFSYSPEALIGKNILTFIHPDDRHYALEVVERMHLSSEKSVIPSDIRLKLKKGEWLNLEAVLTEMIDVPGVNGIVINCRDISEKKMFQAEAIRAGQLASLGELAAGVAHEINNPINGIINYAEMIKDDFDEQGSDSDVPTRIINEGMRIAQIVRSLLSFTSNQKEDYGDIDLNDIFSGSLCLVERQLLKDGVLLSMDIPSDLPGLKARPRELQQVFLNIFSNARYALNQRFPKTNKEKVLEISGSTIKDKDRKYVRTTFHDYGSGMPVNIQDKICNPFFSTKPSDDGNGLGLSISHCIIQNHGGRLLFESVEGEYTKVFVDIPMADGYSRTV